jgi:radical SAM protein with 4Fe4S-binding SPASM domain
MARPASDLLEVDLNVTARCNLKCDFCSVPTRPVLRACDELSLQEIERLLNDLDAMDVETVRLVGGEPFVRRDIEDILALLGSHGFMSQVLTNATVMKRRHVERVRDCGVDLLAFSVDGHKADLHDSSRGKPRSFERLLAMVECCKELGVRRRMMTAVTSETLPHMPELVCFAQEHGFELLNFIVLGLGARANGAPAERFPTYAQWSRAIVGLTRFLAEQRFKVIVSLLFPHEDGLPVELYEPLAAADLLPLLQRVWGIRVPRVPPRWGASTCLAGHSAISIMPNGDVYGCDLMRELPQWCAGNVRKTPVGEIFRRSPLFRGWREQPVVRGCAVPNADSRDFSCAQCRAGRAHLDRGAVRWLPVSKPTSELVTVSS